MSMTKRQLELERAKKRLVMRVDIERMKERLSIDRGKLQSKRAELKAFNK